MSLLLDHGHPGAGDYPLGLLDDETTLVIERQRGYWGTAGAIIQSAAGSVMSKKGAGVFTKLMKIVMGE